MSRSLQQTTKRELWCGTFPRLSVIDSNHVPSWKACGNGHAVADLTLYGGDGDGRLSLDITEFSEGAKSSKRVMLTLDANATRELYEILRARFEAVQS